MSVNETGASCTNCGDYNCTYLCIGCVIRILLSIGKNLDECKNILTTHNGIIIDNYILDEITRELKHT